MRPTAVLLLLATLLSILGPIPFRADRDSSGVRCCCAGMHHECTCTGPCCDHAAPSPPRDASRTCFDAACCTGTAAFEPGPSDPALTPARVACAMTPAPHPATAPPAARTGSSEAPGPAEPPPEAARA